MGCICCKKITHQQPDQCFVTKLQKRTSQVFTTLDVDVEGPSSLSLDFLLEVIHYLLETIEEVIDEIANCKEDIEKNQQLSELVNGCWHNCNTTLEFCKSLEKCLKRASDNQVRVGNALKEFKLEHAESGSHSKKTNYSKTLQELRNIKVAGNTFDDEFFKLLQSVCDQHVAMFEKLNAQKSKLDTKLKFRKSLRNVSNVIFGATFVAVLVCSVVAAAITAPPLVTTLAAAAAVPLGTMGEWINSTWKKYENEIKGQGDKITSLSGRTNLVIMDLNKIRVLVDNLKNEIDSLLWNADFSLENEDAVIVVIGEIRNKQIEFGQTIEELSKRITACRRRVTRARRMISDKIINHPSSSR